MSFPFPLLQLFEDWAHGLVDLSLSSFALSLLDLHLFSASGSQIPFQDSKFTLSNFQFASLLVQDLQKFLLQCESEHAYSFEDPLSWTCICKVHALSLWFEVAFTQFAFKVAEC